MKVIWLRNFRGFSAAVFLLLTGMIFWHCTPSSTGEQERQIEIILSDTLFICDSLHISIWDENGGTLIQVVHSGPPADSIITLILENSIPDIYQLEVRGYSASGEEVYYKSYLYNGSNFVDPQDVRISGSALSARISPRTVTVQPGASVSFTVMASPPEKRSYFWYVNGKFHSLSADSTLVISPVSRDLHGSTVYALAGNESGYGFSDTALLLVEPAPAYELSSPFPVNGAVDRPLFLMLSWAPLISLSGSPAVYSVKFGRDPGDVTYISSDRAENSLAVTGLVPNRTFYWQVIARMGEMVAAGPLWYFTTAASPPGNASPWPPEADSPLDNAADQPVNGLVLRWTGGDPDPNDSLFYDVYLDVINPPESSPLTSKISSGIFENEVSVSGLIPNRRYFWRIVASDKMAVTDSRIFSFITYDAPALFIFQPGPGQQWEGGTLKYISWTYGGGVTSVRLDYSLDGGLSWGLLQDITPASSTRLAWNVPDTVSSRALVRILDVSGTAGDTSGIFSVIDVPVPQKLILVAPVGGEVWQAGGIYPIQWKSEGNILSVKVEFSTGVVWTTITNPTNNDGQFEWTVPDSLVDSLLRIRVSTLDGGVSDTSAGTFTIGSGGIYGEWAYSANVYFNTTPSGAGITGNMLGFPVLVGLDTRNFNFSQSSGGSDIRFTKSDGQTPVDFEIEFWDDFQGRAALWVKVDTLFGNNLSQHVRMYWGNLQAFPEGNPAAVFDTAAGFAGVWHMTDTSDATANHNDAGSRYSSSGQWGGGNTIQGMPQKATGLIGGAFDFDGQNNCLLVDYDQSLDLGDTFTVNGWFRFEGGPAGVDGFQRLLSRKRIWNDPDGWELSLQDNDDRGIQVGSGRGEIDNVENVVTSWKAGGWEYLTLIFSGTSVGVYANGVLIRSVVISPVKDAGDPLAFGDNVSFNEFNFSGAMDEIRLIGGVRSAEWIKLCYENQKEGQTLVRIGP